jgi:membrane peptidoglycan carboxypeptidase
MRAAPQRSPSAMRNIYRSSPFYRRHWFLALVIVLVIFTLIGAVVGYTIHLQFVEKAASFDMDALGKMESASTIYDRQGATFGYIYAQKREPIPIAQMPLDLQHAVVSAEDNRFYTHNGSDLRGMLRASLKNLRSNRIRQGASTITQQLARNTFPLKGRTFYRKILEIYVARRIETTLTKDQILEYYLNRIYLGSGLYGIEAASKGYFGKPARDLTLGEAATLAGLIKSPNNLSPWHDRQAAQAARDFVLGRMVDEEYISREQMDAAVAEKLAVKPRILASTDSYAIEAVRQQVIAQVGVDQATSAGLKIYTTIDARLQKVAEDALRAQLNVVESDPAFQNHQTYAQYSDKFREEEKRALAQDASAPQVNLHNVVGAPEYLQGSLIAMNNSDGAILALVGGRDFKHSEFNRATNPQARRPAGTAFTPFVYAAAYQKGIFPGRLFLDQVIDNRQVMVGGQTGILGEWGVEQADNHYEGPISAQIALIEGKNAATVRVGNEVGLDDVLALAKRAGINSTLRNFPATFLGSSEMTLSELALAYTSFPNGGWHAAAPYLLTKIEDADGEVLYQAKARPRVRTVDEGPAYQVHAALQEDLLDGNAAAATRQLGLKPMAAGGKPGTSYNFSDALFAGYNSEVTCAVWEGFDKPAPIYRGAFGSKIAMPVWVDVMNAAAQYLPPREIPVPRMLKKVEICDRSGDLATDRCFEVVDGKHVPTTFVTYATTAEMPRLACPVHGGGRSSAAALASARALESAIQPVAGGPPRAIAVVDTGVVVPVAIKSPTVLLASGKDPYGALTPVIGAAAEPAPGAPRDAQGPDAAAAATAASSTKEVRRALPVTAAEPDTTTPAVKVDPPDTLQFN